MIHINAFKRSLKNDRGQVGIGTLIIFIAMVLVAAVAAGVLINTSGQLQAKATDTGSDAQAQVSNQIDAVAATGVTDADPDATPAVAGENVQSVDIIVKKSPGSDIIDLSKATIYYVSDSQSATLSYADSGASGADTSNNVNFNARTTAKDDDMKILTGSDDRAIITINILNVENDDTSTTTGGLAEGKTATLRVVDQSGATTTYVINAPETIGMKEVVQL